VHVTEIAEARSPRGLRACVRGRLRRKLRHEDRGKHKAGGSLHGAPHSPVANKNWPIAVIVTDLSGKPIAATLQMNVLFAGARVGQIDNGKIYHFVGRHHEIINWPLNAVGHPLTLQSVVKAKGKTQKLLWAISVAKK
jgi:hypothetical protein